MQDEDEELGMTVGSEEMEEVLSGIDEVRVNTNLIVCVTKCFGVKCRCVYSV